MKYCFWGIVLLAVILFPTGCSDPTGNPATENTNSKSPSETIDLMVFASSSLTQSFTELGTVFEAQHPRVKVSFNFQNANTLAQQIEQGAPADVFAAAAERFMENAVGTGRVNQDDVKIFAENRLVVIYPKKNPANIKTLGDLVNPGIKLVAGAKESPIGGYVETFLTKASKAADLSTTYKENFYRNVVSYESTVNGVVTKVGLGEADAGIVFFSDSQGKAVERVDILEIPESLNIQAQYPIAVLNDSQNAALAKEFVDLVLSPTGQEILEKYGFTKP